MSIRPPGLVRVFFTGQSRNFYPLASNSVDAYPTRLMSNYPGIDWRADDIAFSGYSWTNLTPLAARDLHRRLGHAANNVIVCCGGEADIFGIAGNDTGAVAFADITAYVDAARTAATGHGTNLYAIGTTLCGSNTISATRNGRRIDYNDLMVADAAGDFDEVADLDGTAIGGPASGSEVSGIDDTYYADGVHWNALGAQLAADTIEPHMDAILTTIGYL